jgi:hypothetical protein
MQRTQQAKPPKAVVLFQLEKPPGPAAQPGQHLEPLAHLQQPHVGPEVAQVFVVGDVQIIAPMPTVKRNIDAVFAANVGQIPLDGTDRMFVEIIRMQVVADGAEAGVGIGVVDEPDNVEVAA